MKKHTLSRAARFSALAGALALTACDKPASGLDPLQKTDEKTVFDSGAGGTPTSAPATSTAPESKPVIAKNEPPKVETPKPTVPPKVETPPVKPEEKPAVATTPPPAPAPAPTPAPPAPVVVTGPKITIKPEMPKPLFAGTPLPDSNPPPNLDKSQKPTLEMSVPEGVTLLSKGKPVTCSDPAPLGELSWITDGEKQGDDGYFVDILPLKQWVQIDLEASKEIHLIWVWHFHKQGVIYKDVVVQVSDDPDFKTATTVFNNDFDNSAAFGVGKDQSWVETNNGRPMPVAGVKGRYVRLYSNGRSIDDTNQYIEVEVYGK
ncbi:MAG TPA: hypothetical protein VG796_17910 [Verrucomicrobiales bacterium]|nr:hypothetical protein [Verrucomicrobiales bacterium]